MSSTKPEEPKTPSFNKPFLLDEYEISKWAFSKCVGIIDYNEEGKLDNYKDFIKHPLWAYRYYNLIDDDPEIRKMIDFSYLEIYYPYQTTIEIREKFYKGEFK